jgi:hypothetical protein
MRLKRRSMPLTFCRCIFNNEFIYKKMNKLSVKILLSSIVFLSQLFNFNDRALSININNNYDDIDFNLEWRNRDYFYYTQNFLATIYSQNLWESKTTLWQQNLWFIGT